MKGLAKVLGLVVFVLFLTGVASATMGGLEQETQLILKAATPPVIDGDLDPIWQNAQEHIQTLNEGTVQDDWFDLFGSWRMLWDEEFIYLFFYRMDDVIVDEHANAYEQDGTEFYFDADNSKVEGSFDGINDIQIRVNHWYTQDSEITFWYGTAAAWDPAFDPTGIVLANKDMDSGLGFTTEVAVPVANILMEPEPGLEFGFEHQTNDNDGAARDVVGKWWNASGDSWFDAGIWGTCVLSGQTTSEVQPVFPITGPVAIDGAQDDAWKTLPVYSCNTFVWDDTPFDETLVDDWTDNRIQFQTAYDADNFYCLTKVYDDVIVDEHANTHEQDGVEWYFDGDNSKVNPYDGLDDTQMRINHWHVTTDDITGTFGSAFDKSTVDFAVAEDDNGFLVEFSVPLATIGIDATAGTVFGWEVQTNDNDAAARDVMRRWWHHSNESWRDASIFGEAELVTGTVGVAERPGVVREFALGQNYPNPFNPVTTIPYSVKTSGHVKLAVYDLMGKEVATLVDGTQSAGSYDATLNGHNLVSGVYFYKLQTADQTVTRKMTLMK
ncbi:T9SS type A sorting domain-containing protein [bacterium]|nr:T9SS type A sorting domain-containing protein [bacterium]